MTNYINSETIKKINTLYKENLVARNLFDWAAARQRNAKETTIDTLGRVLCLSRSAAVSLARQLNKAGCGKFVTGRHGCQSRFIWAHNCISLGRVASGAA